MAQVLTAKKTRTDHQIHQAVLQELKWDTQVDETEVGVEVDGGIVTLTGTVESFAKKTAAEEAAHRVGGVLDVANDIQVKLDGTITDTAIAQEVRQALEWNVLIPHEQIKTTVRNGYVTLEGQVPILADLHAAEQAIRYLAGVRGIANHLIVCGPSPEPAEIRHTIEAALERRALHEADRIKVSIDNGTVTLHGQVRNWGEKIAIRGAVSHAPGVRYLDDYLLVEPG